MDSQTNEPNDEERSRESQPQSEESRPGSKLRDLPPEKDPMGSGVEAESQIALRNIQAEAN
jgi:hypothetical protein